MKTVEYIWLDGSDDMPQIRSKVRLLPTVESILPDWSFDGGSTKQGDLKDSDRTLKPVKIYVDPFREDGYLALCEVLYPDGTPHESNNRAKLREMDLNDVWFGFEQEYTITDPMMNPVVPEEQVQGEFYCGNGAGKVVGRLVAEEHMIKCEKAGLDLFGYNAEVMLSQWEYQTQPKTAVDASDNLWISRFINERNAEKFNMRISYHPKIYKDLNGAGCHVNVSTKELRESLDTLENIMKKFKKAHKEHMEVYGVGNELRLTGECETSDYNKFTHGVGDRSASVRIPSHVEVKGCGYFEDRRPAATCDPYLVTARILKTLSC
jgi:glutamine synthetase